MKCFSLHYQSPDGVLLNCDLQTVAQDHGVQYSQLHHSMANVKIYKCLPKHFALALIISEIKQFIVYLQKVGKGHGVQFSQLHYLIASVQIYKCLPPIFTLVLTVSEIYKFYFFSSKSRSRSLTAILQLYHSKANVKIYKRHFHIVIFDKV